MDTDKGSTKDLNEPNVTVGYRTRVAIVTLIKMAAPGPLDSKRLREVEGIPCLSGRVVEKTFVYTQLVSSSVHCV